VAPNTLILLPEAALISVNLVMGPPTTLFSATAAPAFLRLRLALTPVALAAVLLFPNAINVKFLFPKPLWIKLALDATEQISAASENKNLETLLKNPGAQTVKKKEEKTKRQLSD
jgi:hypothetical protein